jgi:acyl-CoA thioester hydrolase
MRPFKHKIKIQIRFKDLDMLGHVNNANYFTFVELARLKYFDHVLSVNTDWHSQNGLILAHFDIDYKEIISYDESIYVHTRCSRLGTKSFDLNWIITKDINSFESEIIVAEGKAVITCYDYEKNRTKPIPPDRRKLINSYECLQ